MLGLSRRLALQWLLLAVVGFALAQNVTKTLS
jgi:hypothetical protein